MRGIYRIAIERPDGSRIYYVGKSVAVEKRKSDHASTLQAGRHMNKFLQRAYDKYGLPIDWFLLLEVIEGATEEELIARETYWLAWFTDKYGSAAMASKVVPSRSPMSVPETRAKVSATRRNWSPEKKAARAVQLVTQFAKTYIFCSPEGLRVEVYNLLDFCRENGLAQPHMQKVARGARFYNSHKGWTRWED